MTSQSVTNSAIPSLVPPEVQALLGDPPVLTGEDDGLYHTLMEQFAKLVEPQDMIEWWWVKDMTDHSWEIRRLRRFKALFVDIQRDAVIRGRAAEIRRREIVATLGVKTFGVNENAESVPVPDSERDRAEMFKYVIDQYKNVDQLVASAERRRDRTLREIEFRRGCLARRLRKASDEAIAGEPAELPEAAE